jgi:hypothetical protein
MSFFTPSREERGKDGRPSHKAPVSLREGMGRERLSAYCPLSPTKEEPGGPKLNA